MAFLRLGILIIDSFVLIMSGNYQFVKENVNQCIQCSESEQFVSICQYLISETVDEVQRAVSCCLGDLSFQLLALF